MQLTFEAGDPSQAVSDALVVLVGTGSDGPDLVVTSGAH